MGPGAVGGDGGDGGDGMTFISAVQAGDIIEAEVGGSAQSPGPPGQHPLPGGDTVIRHKTAAGELIREYRVKGGSSPRSGRIPDDWATITPADLNGGFQVSTLMPVRSWDFHMGRLHILGGAWAGFEVPQLPCEEVWWVICVAGWEELEPNVTRGLQMCITNPDGEEVSRVALGLPSAALTGFNFIWPTAIGATFDREGLWSLHVQSGQYLLSRLVIRVSLVADDFQQ